jgi:hypothetical protein
VIRLRSHRAQTGVVTRGKKLFEGLSQHLEDGETIQHVVDGTYEVDAGRRDAVRHGLAVATDRRLLFFALTAYGKHQVESFRYPTITSFEQSRGLMGGSVSFTTADTRATVKLIPPGSTFIRFCRWMQSQVDAAHPVEA